MDRRRSPRVPLSTPVLVLSRDPFLTFRGRFDTVDVSCHGCRFIIPGPLQHNARLSLTILSNNRIVTAFVARSIPVMPGPNVDSWFVGVELDTPGNYWDVDLLSSA